MIKILAAGFVFSAITLGTLGAYAATMEPAKMGDTSKGKAWTDAKGMTLYTFEKDTATKSNCNGECAVEWPPLAVAADGKADGDWTIVTRDDGSKQWALKGKLLNLWIKDERPGDATGEGPDGFR